MRCLWLFAVALLVGPAVYLIVPVLVCRLDRRLASGSLTGLFTPFLSRKIPLPVSWLPGKFRRKIVQRLQRAGWFSDTALPAYLFSQIAPVPALLLFALLSGLDIWRSVLAGVVLITLANARISRRIIQRQKAFAKALYKIYRFLDLQLTAGIKITDSLRGLPEAVDDPIVKPILIRFSALYELTLDLDLSLAEIRLAFRGTDSELLATHLRQCLQTGDAGRSLARMEELLFSRYFNLMQNDTRQIRIQLLLAAMLGILPGLILFLYPLLYQAAMAMQSVFG